VGVPITATSAGAKSHHAGGNAHAMGFAKEKGFRFELAWCVALPCVCLPQSSEL